MTRKPTSPKQGATALITGLFFATSLCITGSVQATNYYVDSSDQFNALKDKYSNSFATLRSGDRVFLKGGTNWGGIKGTLTGSMTDANAQTNPAIVYACDTNYVPMVGGVTISGVSQVNLAGTGIVFAGLTFSPASGMYPVGNATDYDDTGQTAWMISTAGGSRYNTISHIKFDHCGVSCTNTNDHYGPWVMMYGYHNTLQYCDFQGRDFNPNDINVIDNGWNRTSIRDGTVVVLMQNADTAQWGHHTIRYNYFGPKLIGLNNDPNYYAPTDGVGASQANNFYEVIRLGVGGQATNTFACIVENNAFYHAFWSVYGGLDDNLAESEMISAKSRGNIIRNNTVLNTHGGISLRQNDYSTVVGNFIIGGGSYDTNGNIVLNESVSSEMGGVRSFGFGNIIANNYFYNLVGSSLASAFALGEGTNTTGTLDNLSIGVATDNNTFYETANYNWVIGNTFYNCVTINLDLQRKTYTNPVFATRFINNLIYYSSNNVNGITGTGLSGQNTDALANHGGIAWGNWIYSPTSAQLGSAVSMLGNTSNTITTTSNPMLTATYAGLYVPQTNSPVIGQGYAIPPVNDTSDQAFYHDLAGYVAKFSAIDMRGLARPASAQEIGDYQGSALGSGSRPLKRYEVGIVTNTYYPILLPSTNVTVAAGNLNQVYSGGTIQATSTTTPLNIPVTYTYNGATTPPANAGTYTVVAAVYDPLYGGSTTTNLVIAQATPVITITGTNQFYSGSALPVTTSTAPAGVPVTVTYSNDTYGPVTNAPTNAGSYTVTAVASATANTTGATNTTILRISLPGYPTAYPGSIATLTNNAVILDLLTLASDNETVSAQLRFSVGSASNGTVTLLADGHTAQFTPSNGYTGPASFAYTVTDTTASTNLLLNYTFQSTNPVINGSAVADASGNTNTGTLSIVGTGSAAYTNSGFTNLVPLQSNSMVLLQGTSGAAGISNAIPVSALNFTNHDWTVAGWFYHVPAPGTNGLTNRHVIFQYGSGSSGSGNNMNLFVETNATLRFNINYTNSTTANGTLYITTSGTLTPNAWHQFAVVSSNGLLSLYSDGVLAQSTNNPPMPYTTNRYFFGGITNSASRLTNWFNGSLADLALFNTALSASDIFRLMNLPAANIANLASSSTVSVSVTNTLLPVAITFSETNQVYDGSGKTVSPAPSPAGAVPLSVTYSNGSYGPSTNGPTNAGSYTVVATTLNTNYTGSTTATLTVTPATPVITLSGTNRPYNGTARPVAATITPPGIPVSMTYNDSSSAPTNVGNYAVFANNGATANWNTASATSTLTIYDPVSSWRQSVYGTGSNAGSAADTAKVASGLNNLQSYTFGVDPSQATTTPLLMISNTAANTITLSFVARSAGNTPGYNGLNRYYNLEGTTNATNGSWSPLPGYSNIQGADQSVVLTTNTSVGPKWFYRLKAWLQ